MAEEEKSRDEGGQGKGKAEKMGKVGAEEKSIEMEGPEGREIWKGRGRRRARVLIVSQPSCADYSYNII